MGKSYFLKLHKTFYIPRISPGSLNRLGSNFYGFASFQASFMVNFQGSLEHCTPRIIMYEGWVTLEEISCHIAQAFRGWQHWNLNCFQQRSFEWHLEHHYDSDSNSVTSLLSDGSGFLLAKLRESVLLFPIPLCNGRITYPTLWQYKFPIPQSKATPELQRSKYTDVLFMFKNI